MTLVELNRLVSSLAALHDIHVPGENHGRAAQIDILPLQHVDEQHLQLGLDLFERLRHVTRLAEGGAPLLRSHVQKQARYEVVNVIRRSSVSVKVPKSWGLSKTVQGGYFTGPT